MLEFALRFCISDPTVSHTIPGVGTPEQAEFPMHAMQAGPLPEDTLRRRDELWEQEFKHHIRTSIGLSSEA